MEDIILTEEDGIGYAVPEASHVEDTMQGLVDTVDQINRGVAGVESLTSAQRYLQGALAASGAFSLTRVSGNEGFLATVADGVKKAYEYVVRMFKQLWAFFFKRDNKKKSDDAKEEVKVVTQQIAAVKAGGSTEAETDKRIADLKHSVQSEIAAATEENNEAAKKELHEISVELEEVASKPQAEKKQILSKEARRFAKASTRTKKKLQAKIAQLVDNADAAMDVLGQAIDKVSKDVLGGPLVMNLEDSFRDFRGVRDSLKTIPVMDDPDALISGLNKLTVQIEAFRKSSQELGTEEAYLKKRIEKVGQFIANPRQASDEDQKVVLEQLRVVLTCTTRVAQLAGNFYDGVTSAAKLGLSLFGQK